MKILYVVPFVPWPVKVRSFNLIPRLARKHSIHLVCVSSVEPSSEQWDWIGHYCETAEHVPHSTWQAIAQCVGALPTKTPLRMAYCGSKRARETVRRVFEETRPDLVYVERWRALPFLPEKLDVPLVCDPTDSMTLYNRRLMHAGAWWERLVGWEEYRKFADYEGKLARRADVTVFCSRLDLECVKEQASDAEYELVPNGVDCQKYYFKEEREEHPSTIVFTGSFRYRPNRHAAEWFLKEIFPRIRTEVTDAKFLAVGNGALTALTSHLAVDGFEAKDYVPDLRPYLAAAAVAVAPLTVGSGVSNKIAEGFSVGTPVVATPLACGDLPVKNGEQLLIGRNPDEFAAQVVKLLRDAALRRLLSWRARRFVEQSYDWERVSTKMEEVLQKAVLKKARTGAGELVATA
jgi:glycosyltransferase involved in cell wall biosynthesis